jgi:hypothetical protein
MTRREPRGERMPGVHLIFAYDADGIRLTARVHGAEVVGPSDDVTVEPPETAIAAELRTGRDVPIFRRVVEDAIPETIEAFDPDGGVFRVPGPRESGAFAVVVPDDERARDVVLVAGARGVPRGLRFAPPPGARAAARAIARFSFRGDEHGNG